MRTITKQDRNQEVIFVTEKASWLDALIFRVHDNIPPPTPKTRKSKLRMALEGLKVGQCLEIEIPEKFLDAKDLRFSPVGNVARSLPDRKFMQEKRGASLFVWRTE